MSIVSLELRSTCSGGNVARWCLAWPCCPPRLRLPLRRDPSGGGLTMSLEGGLEELELLRFSRASWSSNCRIRRCNWSISLTWRSASACHSAMLRSCGSISR